MVSKCANYNSIIARITILMIVHLMYRHFHCFLQLVGVQIVTISHIVNREQPPHRRCLAASVNRCRLQDVLQMHAVLHFVLKQRDGKINIVTMSVVVYNMLALSNLSYYSVFILEECRDSAAAAGTGGGPESNKRMLDEYFKMNTE